MAAARARVLFDAFHHMMPGHRIGKHIATGGYAVNFGRYSPGDCYHPNGLAFPQAALKGEFNIRLLTQPYSELSLFDADILLITNPDYPLYEGASPYRWTPEDVDALWAFLERGGGVILGVNSFLSRPDFWEENFDLERVSLLFERLGIRWDPHFMSDENLELARSGDLRVAYGQGGRVLEGKLPQGAEKLLVRDQNVYGFCLHVGKGTLAVIGDTGLMSNGLTSFPGYDNLAFVRGVFERARPSWLASGIQRWDLVASGHLSSAPSEHGLNESVLRSLRPDATWMKDYHYRHLVWDKAGGKAQDEEVWATLPVRLHGLSDTPTVPAKLNWLSVDTDAPGPELALELNGDVSRSRDAADVHLIGTARSEGLSWKDLCENADALRVAGEVERVSTVFELRAVLDGDRRPARCRWSQGQIIHSRSRQASHYGYEIILLSSSGAILPRAVQ